MPTSSKSLFVTPSEFSAWLQETAREIGASVIVYRGPHIALEAWGGQADPLLNATRVYIAAGSPNLTDVPADRIAIGKLGWVQLDVPRTDDRRLLAVQLGAKTDWYDAREGKIQTNSASVRLLRRFWSKWKRHFKSPMWARNLITGRTAKYADVGYSEGAEEWLKQGGALLQEGVANVEFRTQEWRDTSDPQRR